jgi:2-polyprenyl-3-methyl-5-hydroxy-6-metoxy-1,4-benzoquinol methylase
MKNKEFYNKTSMEGGFFGKKFSIMSSLVEPGTTVLDLGCYDGRLGDFLVKNLNCTVDGSDVSDVNIAKATSLRDKYVFDLNDEAWPINKKYDYVIFTDVIEHILNTDQFMINVRKLVKDGGHIIFATPNIASFGRRLMLLFGKNPYIEVSNHREVNLFDAPVVGHIRYFTLDTMKSIAEFHGYQVEKIVPTSFIGGYSNRLLEKLFPSLCWHIFIKAKKV